MIPVTEAEIRRSVVNCSQGEAKRLRVPVGLADTAWEPLDFLGWRDPGAPAAAYLVAEWRGTLTGLVMRLSTDRRATGRQNMCALCSTVHSTTDVA
ncbi:MAG: FBP domain-containing protein, partial [Nocardioides sp.]|uniref:FBP domain-containing protein n=1 Tax=Nocardioides sp. TaxID=35761 RepID=UPI003263EAD2